MIIGPLHLDNYFYSSGTTTFTGFRLDDADDSICYIYMIPKNGTINRLGIHLSSKAGTPPDYNIGLVTLNTSGQPTTTAYGGSATQTISPNSMSTGWHWITLATPATGVAGDLAAIRIWPTASVPSIANYAAFSWDDIFESALPRQERFNTSWLPGAGIPSSALKYSDDTIEGFPVSSFLNDLITTDEEWGIYFQLPWEAKCIGMVFSPIPEITIMDFTGILYDSGNTVLGSVRINDEDYVDNGWKRVHIKWPEVTLSADTVYRCVIKGNHANGIRLNGIEIPEASLATQFVPECTFYLTERSGGGSWTNTNTKIPYMGIIISEITAGGGTPPASSGEGGPYGFVG